MRRALILCLCLAPTLVSAAGFEIRSGEHDGFSRLVIYLDRPREWDVTATDSGYQLTVPDSPQSFDTSGVFEFIPKRRLTDIKAVPGRLTLDVPCDCPVQAFAYRPDILVLDIYSDQPDPESVPDSLIVQSHLASPPDRIVESAPPSDAVTVEEVPVVAPAAVLSDWEDRGGQASRATRLLGFSPPAALTDQRLDHSELIAGIAQAASRGLVTLSEADTRGVASDFPVVPGLRVAGSQLSVRDSLMRGYPPTGLPAASQLCLPADLFAVADWGDPDTPASVVLSDLRADGPAGPAGPSGAEGAIGMIRSYLYLGFGSEAAELVRTYRMSKHEERVYRALAKIIDYPGGADLNPLADQLRCDGPAALWAFVATRNLQVPGSAVDADTILRSFQDLPWWLRVQIGETAAANFEAQGDTVSAASIRASVARARAAEAQKAGEDPNAQISSDADRSGADHHAQSDRAHRMRSAQAMLYQRKNVGSLPAAEDRDEITALVLETRGSEESVALLENYIEFVSAPDDILAAEHLLTVLKRSRFANAYPIRASWNALLAASVAQPSHDVFLGILARNRREFQRTPPDRVTADAVIARLIATGLPQSAAEYSDILEASPGRQDERPGGAAARLGPADLQDGSVQNSDPIAAGQPNVSSGAVTDAGEQTGTDAEILRELLTAYAVEGEPFDPSLAGTENLVQQTTTPLEVLLASETAVEVLDRVLGSVPDTDG